MMKKLTFAAVSALALVSAGANAKNFDGFNAGLRAKYNWSNHELKFTDSGLKAQAKPKGAQGDLVFGYMNNLGNDVVLGMEAFFGWANYEGKGKVNDLDAYTLQKTYSLGLDFLAGYTFMPDLLGYGRFGIHGTKNKFKITDDGDSPFNHDEFIPEYAIGAGLKYEVIQNISLDLGYTYSMDLKKYSYHLNGIKIAEDDNAHNHAIHLGVSYQF